MGMPVSFNSFDLVPGILEVTEGFTPHAGASFSPTVSDSPFFRGGEFVRTRISAKSIPMPFIIRHDWKTGETVTQKYDKLMQILNVKEPAPLKFGVMNDRTFMAIPSGDIQFSELPFVGKGTITWIIPDGVGQVDGSERQLFKLNGDVLEAELVNNGTDDAAVDYYIEHQGENGYIGISSQYGAMEFGDINEVDGSPTTMTENILFSEGYQFDKWTAATTFYENSSKQVFDGVPTTKDYEGQMGAAATHLFDTDPSGITGRYFGKANELLFTDSPADDWYLWARAWFETGKVQQTGMWTISIVAEDNTIIAAMSIQKNTANSNTAICTFQLGNAEGKTTGMKNINFTPSYWIPPNPYGSQSREGKRNVFDIRKSGNKVRFFWYGSYFEYVLPDVVASKKATRVQFFIGQFKGQKGNVTPHMFLSDIQFRKINVPAMKDEPNRFAQNSVAFVDGVNEKFFYQTQPRAKDQVIGSSYFKIPPGKTLVQIKVSSFASPKPNAYAVVHEVKI